MDQRSLSVIALPKQKTHKETGSREFVYCLFPL